MLNVRYEHEQAAVQEAENQLEILKRNSEFNIKVSSEQIGELQSRIESSAAVILSLEAKVRELSNADTSVSELLKQLRESSEVELKIFQIETEDLYNRNVSSYQYYKVCDVFFCYIT